MASRGICGPHHHTTLSRLQISWSFRLLSFSLWLHTWEYWIAVFYTESWGTNSNRTKISDWTYIKQLLDTWKITGNNERDLQTKSYCTQIRWIHKCFMVLLSWIIQNSTSLNCWNSVLVQQRAGISYCGKSRLISEKGQQVADYCNFYSYNFFSRF